MIYSLTGKIIKKTLNAVVICCCGVGYYAQCPASVAGALPGVGNEEQDVKKKIMMVVGACIFLIAAAQALPLFFGIGG